MFLNHLSGLLYIHLLYYLIAVTILSHIIGVRCSYFNYFLVSTLGLVTTLALTLPWSTSVVPSYSFSCFLGNSTSNSKSVSFFDKPLQLLLYLVQIYYLGLVSNSCLNGSHRISHVTFLQNTITSYYIR